MERDQHKKNAFIHFLLPLLLSTHWLSWSLSQRPSGHTSLSHKTNKQPLAPTVNLEFPQITSHAYFWSVGGSQRTQRRTHRHRGEHANCTRKEPPGDPQGSNPQPSCCLWRSHRTTVSPGICDARIYIFLLFRHNLFSNLWHLNERKIWSIKKQNREIMNTINVFVPHSDW